MVQQGILMGILALTHILCFAVMTEQKYSIRKTVLIYALYAVFFIGWTFFISAFIGANSPYTASAMFSATIVAAFFVFILTSADLFCKKLFLFISYSNLFCIFYCMSAIISDVLFPGLSETEMRYARSITRTLLYIPTVLAYLKFLRPRIRTVPVKRERTWNSISLVSVLFLAVFTSYLIRFYPHSGHTTANILSFADMILLYCSVLWVIFGTIRQMDYEAKTEFISKNAEYLQGQLALARENELTAKAIRHDFRHHNRNIAMLLQKGNVKEALRYVEQYDESLDVAGPKEFCLHATVNAILNSFYIRAQKDGISVSISTDMPEKSPIEDTDFVAILSNLLENALNGCKECESHGEIRINIRTASNATVIVCRNPCKSNLKIENGMICKRGTGIDSVVLAVRKYDGHIQYKMEKSSLVACVVLYT